MSRPGVSAALLCAGRRRRRRRVLAKRHEIGPSRMGSGSLPPRVARSHRGPARLGVRGGGPARRHCILETRECVYGHTRESERDVHVCMRRARRPRAPAAPERFIQFRTKKTTRQPRRVVVQLTTLMRGLLLAAPHTASTTSRLSCSHGAEGVLPTVCHVEKPVLVLVAVVDGLTCCDRRRQRSYPASIRKVSGRGHGGASCSARATRPWTQRGRWPARA